MKLHKPCHCEMCTRDRYCSPCAGCKDGHPSFWKTVTESPQWEIWQKEQQRRSRTNETIYDMPEVEELGCIGKEHFQDFIRFTIAVENKEWREGRRCEVCGEHKEPNLTTMCDNCLENG